MNLVKTYIKQILQRLIFVQHRIFPMPIWLFGYFYSFKFIKNNFGFYGNCVFQSSYSVRGGDNISYWLSRESLYWHFWRQTDVDMSELQEVLAIPKINQILHNDSLVAVELGFGAGKNYGSVLKNNRLKKYIAIETNKYLCDYCRSKFQDHNNFDIINQSIREFTYGDLKFDILICSGGVLMYLDKETLDVLFESLPKRGVQTIVILNEGTAQDDNLREDNTIMFNFRKRLPSYATSKDYYEKSKENEIYRYFVMC